MSFKKYLREQEEVAILKVENDKKSKLVDFIKTIDDLNDSKFKEFAVSELGMTDDEADTVVFKMLKDFLLKGDTTDIADDDIGGVEFKPTDDDNTDYEEFMGGDDEEYDDIPDDEDEEDMEDWK